MIVRRGAQPRRNASSGKELRLRRVLHDLAFLHHEGDALGGGDVGSGVAGNGDDVACRRLKRFAPALRRRWALFEIA